MILSPGGGWRQMWRGSPLWGGHHHAWWSILRFITPIWGQVTKLPRPRDPVRDKTRGDEGRYRVGLVFYLKKDLGRQDERWRGEVPSGSGLLLEEGSGETRREVTRGGTEWVWSFTWRRIWGDKTRGDEGRYRVGLVFYLTKDLGRQDERWRGEVPSGPVFYLTRDLGRQDERWRGEVPSGPGLLLDEGSGETRREVTRGGTEWAWSFTWRGIWGDKTRDDEGRYRVGLVFYLTKDLGRQDERWRGEVPSGPGLLLEEGPGETRREVTRGGTEWVWSFTWRRTWGDKTRGDEGRYRVGLVFYLKKDLGRQDERWRGEVPSGSGLLLEEGPGETRREVTRGGTEWARSFTWRRTWGDKTRGDEGRYRVGLVFYLKKDLGRQDERWRGEVPSGSGLLLEEGPGETRREVTRGGTEWVWSFTWRRTWGDKTRGDEGRYRVGPVFYLKKDLARQDERWRGEVPSGSGLLLDEGSGETRREVTRGGTEWVWSFTWRRIWGDKTRGDEGRYRVGLVFYLTKDLGRQDERWRGEVPSGSGLLLEEGSGETRREVTRGGTEWAPSFTWRRTWGDKTRGDEGRYRVGRSFTWRRIWGDKTRGDEGRYRVGRSFTWRRIWGDKTRGDEGRYRVGLVFYLKKDLGRQDERWRGEVPSGPVFYLTRDLGRQDERWRVEVPSGPRLLLDEGSGETISRIVTGGKVHLLMRGLRC